MDFASTPICFLYEDEAGNRIYIKREDLLPYSFGGNKVRIALELLEDMKAQGADHMIAYGNARSNLCRVLSNLCAGSGIPCTILSPADDDGAVRESYNQKMCHFFGAEIVPCLKTGVKATVENALEQSRRLGRTPYYLYGNSNGTGNLVAPVRAYRKVWTELLRQQAEMQLPFHHIFHASGTGMTQAGLLAGKALDGGDAQVHGISIARKSENGASHITKYLQAFLGKDAPLPQIDFVDAYAETYGVYTKPMVQTVQTMLTHYGIPLDMTYTGKAFYGMLEEIKARGLTGQNILFIHTGGTPLFFDKPEILV